MEYLQNVLIIFSLFFGSIIGSFLNVVILRLPNEEKLQGRSHCFNCKKTLGYLDLFPIFSYLFLGGRCRYCKTKISVRYITIELLTGLLFALAVYFLKPLVILDYILLLKFLIAISALLVIFVVDLENFIILDSVLIFVAISVSVLNLILDIFTGVGLFNIYSNFFGGLLAAVIAWLPFFMLWYISKGKWMGFGDVKLALVLGIILGFPNIFVGLMLSVLLGGFVSVLLLTFTSKTLQTKLPFGTFLSIGTILALFYGNSILNWYLAFLGF